jgi:hypothetical protein
LKVAILATAMHPAVDVLPLLVPEPEPEAGVGGAAGEDIWDGLSVRT